MVSSTYFYVYLYDIKYSWPGAVVSTRILSISQFDQFDDLLIDFNDMSTRLGLFVHPEFS